MAGSAPVAVTRNFDHSAPLNQTPVETSGEDVMACEGKQSEGQACYEVATELLACGLQCGVLRRLFRYSLLPNCCMTQIHEWGSRQALVWLKLTYGGEL